MLEYVYAFCDGGDKKIPCSAREGNLPDFSGIGETEQSYEKKLLQYEEYLEWYAKQDIKRLAYEDLFNKNLGLFIEKHAEILSNPQFASIMWPHRFCGMMYADYDNLKYITLGEILSIFINEPKFAELCPKCGGIMYLVYFGGSPLSGIIYESHYVCSACKKMIDDKTKKSSHGEMRKIRNKYSMKYSDIQPLHIMRLIDSLKGNTIPNEAVANSLDLYHTNNWYGFEVTTEKPLECHLTKCGTQIELDMDYNKKSKHFITNILKNKLSVSIPERCWTAKFKTAVKKAGHKGFMGEW